LRQFRQSVARQNPPDPEGNSGAASRAADASRHSSRSSISGASSVTVRGCRRLFRAFSCPSLSARSTSSVPLAHVPPLERQRLLRPQPGVSEHDEQRRVAQPALRAQARAHDLDQRRRDCLDGWPVALGRLARQLDRVAGHPAPLDRPLQDVLTLNVRDETGDRWLTNRRTYESRVGRPSSTFVSAGSTLWPR
jgi:hypothetical protein